VKKLVKYIGWSRSGSTEPPLTRWDVAVVVFQILGILLALVGLVLKIVGNLG